MKKTKKLKQLQLKATTVRQLTKDLIQVTGGQMDMNDETRVRTCSCGGPCNEP